MHLEVSKFMQKVKKEKELGAKASERWCKTNTATQIGHPVKCSL